MFLSYMSVFGVIVASIHCHIAFISFPRISLSSVSVSIFVWLLQFYSLFLWGVHHGFLWVVNFSLLFVFWYFFQNCIIQGNFAYRSRCELHHLLKATIIAHEHGISLPSQRGLNTFALLVWSLKTVFMVSVMARESISWQLLYWSETLLIHIIVIDDDVCYIDYQQMLLPD